MHKIRNETSYVQHDGGTLYQKQACPDFARIGAYKCGDVLAVRVIPRHSNGDLWAYVHYLETEVFEDNIDMFVVEANNVPFDLCTIWRHPEKKRPLKVPPLYHWQGEVCTVEDCQQNVHRRNNIMTMAIYQNDLWTVQVLAEAFVEEVDKPFNKDGQTPLMMARTVEMVALLIQHGTRLEERNCIGQTALHCLAMCDCEERERHHVPILRMLCEQKANVNVLDDNGDSPLHIAINSHCYESVKVLCEYKADVNLYCTPTDDEGGDLPLNRALMWNDVKIVRYLLERKAVCYTECLEQWDDDDEDSRTIVHLLKQSGQLF